MDNALQALDVILPYIIYAVGITFIISLFIFIIYLPPILHKKTKLELADAIIEQNVQVVEEALFFKSNSKFQEIINQQLEEIKANSLLIKKEKKIIDDLVAEKQRLTEDISDEIKESEAKEKLKKKIAKTKS